MWLRGAYACQWVDMVISQIHYREEDRPKLKRLKRTVIVAGATAGVTVYDEVKHLSLHFLMQ